MTSACHAEDHGFKSRTDRHYGFIAQSVEQRTENPRVSGSIPLEATIECKHNPFKGFFILSKTAQFLNGYFFIKTKIKSIVNVKKAQIN